VLTQMAFCDLTVPNPFNVILGANLFAKADGTGFTTSLPTSSAFFAGTGKFQLYSANGATPPAFLTADCATSPAGTVGHGFLLNFAPPAAITVLAQQSAASFVTTNADQASWEHN